MHVESLIKELARPTAYPFPVKEVEVKQTHISLVFLAGTIVYKIKKPIQLTFLDFRTLSDRRHYCEEEVRLNRRLAPHVYFGVVPVVRGPNGLQFEGEGEPIEWAVKMRRLPDEATFLSLLERGDLTPALLQQFAHRLAGFHRNAERGATSMKSARSRRWLEMPVRIWNRPRNTWAERSANKSLIGFGCLRNRASRNWPL